MCFFINIEESALKTRTSVVLKNETHLLNTTGTIAKADKEKMAFIKYQIVGFLLPRNVQNGLSKTLIVHLKHLTKRFSKNTPLATEIK